MNFITIHTLHNLNLIIDSPLYIAENASSLEAETECNMWGISLDGNIIQNINIDDLLSFFNNLFQNRTLQLKKVGPAVQARLYVWFDKQALQLRFNIISGNTGLLPFDCQFNIISSLKPIVEEFIQVSQQVAQYGDDVEIENSNDGWEDDDDEELPVLNVFLLVLN